MPLCLRYVRYLKGGSFLTENETFDPVLEKVRDFIMLQADQTRLALQDLKALSYSSGKAVLSFFILQVLIFTLFAFVDRKDLLGSNALFQSAYGALIAFVCLFLPFLFVFKKMSQADRDAIVEQFEKPRSNFLMLIALPAGFMFCMAGNYIVAFFVSLMDSVGVELTAPESPLPSGFLGAVMYIIQIAFIPALVEEFALRGVVMQPLRRFGDGFAIFMSSLVFALMHGNMIQAPFALIAGLAIGYFVIATDSIWTGVLIHFANNLFSSLLTLINGNSSFETDGLYAAFMSLSFVAGIACCVLFVLNPKKISLKKSTYNLGLNTRLKRYLITPPMLLALAVIAYFTAGFINVKG